MPEEMPESEGPAPIVRVMLDGDLFEGLHARSYDGVEALDRVVRAIRAEASPDDGVSEMAPVAHALAAAVRTAGLVCPLEVPTKPVEEALDNDGNWILRCGHVPPHTWDLARRRP